MKKPVEFVKQDGGKVAIRPSIVISVADNPHYPGHCNIYAPDHMTYLVKGSFDEVMKKLYPNNK